MQSILLHQTIPMLSSRTALSKWKWCVFLLLCFLKLTSSAQDRCGTIAPDPTIFEPWLQEKVQNRSLSQLLRERTTEVYEIPIVVHIIEPASGSLNISDERVERQIEILNEDFRRTNADAINTPAEFLPVAADTEIQFVLARQDPKGNPTNGIVRVKGSRDWYSTFVHLDLIRSESFWPPSNYLNVYVLDINTFLGWASFPITTLPGIINENSDAIWDGVLVDYIYFGENPLASSFPSFGRTATHEIGHYFGLRHIWGDGGCGVDDFVTDTPVADDDNGGLSSPCTFPNPEDNTVCSTPEMFQNYMDYTDDGCMNLFTEGQKTRMRTVLENSPRRLSLLTSPALIEPTRFANDLAIADIRLPNEGTCNNLINAEVEVANYGNTAINSYSIALFVGGSQVQSINQTTTLATDEREIISFNNELISSSPTTVEFRITNVNGTSDGNTTNDAMSVSLFQTAALPLPFAEDFESTLNVLGKNGTNFPWETVTAIKENTSNKALTFKSFQNTTAFGEETWIKTPIFDLSGINSAELTFSYSYAQTSSTFWDGLEVKVSTDCGVTFSDEPLFNSFGPALATATMTDDSFVPQSFFDWKDTTINITQFASSNGVQFAFVGQNGIGNNIYLDDIRILQTNLKARDASVLEVDSPILTCKNVSSADFRIRNVGFEEITSLTYEYTSNGVTNTETADELSIISGGFQSISFDINLLEGPNQLSLSILEVNGSSDDDLTNNSADFTINQSTSGEAYPLTVDFEIPNNWSSFSESQSQLWSKTLVNHNWVLQADAFNASEFGSKSWFISPNLTVGLLDSAGLSFKVSYAQRPGFIDRLQVLMSINCGESYTFELLNASSDSLAITESTTSWIPQSDADWKEFKIDLKPSIPWRDDIRLAFVFTNGNGNNLYLDDISVGIKPEVEDENSFKIFPNPATSVFNVAFSLAERDDVVVQLMDVSGRIILTRTYENVLDQVYDINTISEEGFYFVKITGDRINQTERLYIRR